MTQCVCVCVWAGDMNFKYSLLILASGWVYEGVVYSCLFRRWGLAMNFQRYGGWKSTNWISSCHPSSLTITHSTFHYFFSSHRRSRSNRWWGSSEQRLKDWTSRPFSTGCWVGRKIVVYLQLLETQFWSGECCCAASLEAAEKKRFFGSFFSVRLSSSSRSGLFEEDCANQRGRVFKYSLGGNCCNKFQYLTISFLSLWSKYSRFVYVRNS